MHRLAAATSSLAGKKKKHTPSSWAPLCVPLNWPAEPIRLFHCNPRTTLDWLRAVVAFVKSCTPSRLQANPRKGWETCFLAVRIVVACCDAESLRLPPGLALQDVWEVCFAELANYSILWESLGALGSKPTVGDVEKLFSIDPFLLAYWILVLHDHEDPHSELARRLPYAASRAGCFAYPAP